MHAADMLLYLLLTSFTCLVDGKALIIRENLRKLRHLRIECVLPRAFATTDILGPKKLDIWFSSESYIYCMHFLGVSDAQYLEEHMKMVLLQCVTTTRICGRVFVFAQPCH